MECVMICLDNSEWMRNGDFIPSRYESQIDASHLISSHHNATNRENGVGILTMAGLRVEVLVNPTNDVGKIFASDHRVKITGTSDFIRGIQTAQLALKHRFNKTQKQRIICFVGSPVNANEKQLVELGKSLKKNSISLDLISFGSVEVNKEKLKKLHQAVNNSDTSCLLECPSGICESLRNAVYESPIIRSRANPASVDVAMGGTDSSIPNEFGVDPNVDPDLYMALRLSLEEQQARMEETAKVEEAQNALPADVDAAEESYPNPSETVAETDTLQAAVSNGTSNSPHALTDYRAMHQDALEVALRMALESGAATVGDSANSAAAPVAEPDTAEVASTDTEKASGSFGDPLYMKKLLGGLKGVDLSHPRIQKMLKEVGAAQEASHGQSTSSNTEPLNSQSTINNNTEEEEKKKDCEDNERK